MTTIENSIEALAAFIKANGPVPAVRVSSAKPRGRAKQYSYWGATRYQIDLGADGSPCNRPLERAGSDRRTRAGAIRDAEALASDEGRVLLQSFGYLTSDDCEEVLGQIGAVDISGMG